jgi:threonine dehydratase
MLIPTPSNHRPSLPDFRAASKQIEGISLRTPLIPLRWYEENPEILLKPEMLQPIGSYKIRGVYNWVSKLSPEQRARGISTASSGNMAQAVAYVGKLFNIPARAIVFDTAPKTKIDAVKKYGGEVITKSWDDWVEYVGNPPDDRCFIHPFEEFGLMDGHGTIGIEVMEDAPETQTIYVPLGAGLLGAGVALAAKALKSSVRVVGVNPENAPHYYESLKHGRVMDTPPKPTLSDGTAANLISFPNAGNSLDLVKETIDEVVLVSETQIEDAIRYLAVENKLVAEGAGAMSLAAALDAPREERGKTVCILTGGSIDVEKFTKIVSNKQNP